MKADIGLIGLAVMGQNLVLNMADHGWSVAVFNRTASVTQAFADREKNPRIIGAATLAEFVTSIKTPRRIVLLVKAGSVVDDMIAQLVPLLSQGDVLIDCGNSFFEDTVRRGRSLGPKGILFVGSGISGGEEGARHGPSLMPGGDERAWTLIKDIFLDVAAKTAAGEACCTWIGNEGAGHFVKMVHNGIEYGDMQIIAEAYHYMRNALDMSHDSMAAEFRGWNKGDLDSYLIEITAHILEYKDKNGDFLVENIQDSAGQKGTGKWVSQSALDAGVPLTLISEAVFARYISAMVAERKQASELLAGPKIALHSMPSREELDEVQKSLLAAKIISYAQGFLLMRSVSASRDWKLDLGAIAQIWREGCIIRSAFLDRITEAYARNPGLVSLLVDPWFSGVLARCHGALRRVTAKAIEAGIPVPAFSAALAFYDSYRCAKLPANLIQAQRDYFGAHTYERVDAAPGTFFHTDWTGSGGSAVSGTYSA